MAYIPEDAEWYLAWIVEEMRIEGDPRNVVHTNMRLIRADSPEEAYDKALALGQEAEREYENSDGRLVSVIFRGLTDLNVIHEELEDGAELSFEEDVGISEEDLKRKVPAKGGLTVFREDDLPDRPNYMPKDIWEELNRRFEESANEGDNTI